MRSSRWMAVLLVAGVLGSFLAQAKVFARGGWDDLPAVYCFEGDEGDDAYVGTFNDLGNLDGEWRRSNNSDQWDGTTPESGDGAPGGIAIELLGDEGEEGGDASVLSLEDVGDPSGTFPDPSNRKLFLWRDTTDELDLADGITLVARWRLNPEPLADEWDINGGALLTPNGTTLHDEGKGQIGFVQKTAAGGTLPATLALAIDEMGYLQFATETACTGTLFPNENCTEVDTDDWVTVWMAAQEVDGQIQMLLFVNGDDVPVVDEALPMAAPTGAEGAERPEAGSAAASYVLMALGSTGQEGAIQVDYLCVAPGFLEPGGTNPACPFGASAASDGTDVVLEWTNGDVTPAGVDIFRDGAEIATGVSAEAGSYTDGTAEPGALSYELVFDVTGETCDSLTASVNTCPAGLAAFAAPTGVLLSWTNGGEYEELSLSRDGSEIASLAGSETSYLDEGAPTGALVYSLSPTTGTCEPLEATITYLPVPIGSGDYNDVAVDWTYLLDPPAEADPGEYLLYEPTANLVGALDGSWSGGNGSDSWDSSAPGEIGDPLLDIEGVVDPASAAPGGIGLVTRDSVGAYLMEDPGNPVNDGWLDPSNRKLYLAHDVIQDVADANERSLISDGLTLRARLRLTGPDDAVDVADAPNGYALHNDGKGMVVVAHDAAATLTGLNQRIGLALDVNPDVPGSGLLTIGQADDDRGDGLPTTSLAIPIADPTEWLDVWITTEDADGDLATPELVLSLYVNGATEPGLEVDDFVPALQGPEGTGVAAGNQLTIGLGATDQDGSMELDLVGLIDGVVPPEGGPVKPIFHRGDANADGDINITDGIFVLNYLFLGGPTPACLEAANPNDDGDINITDGIYILNYLFLGGPAPTDPGPVESPCGPDPAGSPTDLGCASYESC